MPDLSDREWFLRRMPAYEAGLLHEDEERRYRSLLETVPDLEAAHLEFQASLPVWEDEPEHLSPELLARWGRAEASLRGLERELVKEHLAACATCRHELELLGFGPSLAAGERTAPSRPTERGTRPTPEPATPPAWWEVLQRAFRGSGGLGWAVAAVTLAVFLTQMERESAYAPSLTGLTPSDPILRVRSDGGNPPQIPLSADGRAALLQLLLPGLTPDTAATVSLIDAEGRTAYEQPLPAGGLPVDGVLLLQFGDPPDPGEYTLRVKPVSSSALEFSVEIVAGR